MSYGFNSSVVDGHVGVLSRGDTGSFDNFRIRTDDPAFAAALFADVAPVTVVTSLTLTEEDLLTVVNESKRRWLATGLVNEVALDTIQVSVGDLNIDSASALLLGQTQGSVITLDDNAAGWGWFMDKTLSRDEEFSHSGDILVAASDAEAYGRMDLLSVLMHEIGHTLGFSHSESGDHNGLMGAILGAGVRELPTGGVSYFDNDEGRFHKADKHQESSAVSNNSDDFLVLTDQGSADLRDTMYDLKNAEDDKLQASNFVLPNDETDTESLGAKLRKLTARLYGKGKH